MGTNAKAMAENERRLSRPYEDLCYHVVLQAVSDYASALRILKREPDNMKAKWMRDDCERFFKNNLSLWSDLDGGSLMRAIRRQV